MNRITIIAAATVLAATALTPRADAAVISVDFNVFLSNAYGGYPVGTEGTGSFSFEDSAYAPDSSNSDYANGLPTLSLSFDWLGLSWTEANASIGALEFDAAHTLTGWNIGAAAAGEYCYGQKYGCVSYYFNSEPDFAVGGGLQTSATAVLPGIDGDYALGLNGTWTISSVVDPVSVPEPGTLSLFALGLLGSLVATRRKV